MKNILLPLQKLGPPYTWLGGAINNWIKNFIKWNAKWARLVSPWELWCLGEAAVPSLFSQGCNLFPWLLWPTCLGVCPVVTAGDGTCLLQSCCCYEFAAAKGDSVSWKNLMFMLTELEFEFKRKRWKFNLVKWKVKGSFNISLTSSHLFPWQPPTLWWI